MTAIQKTPQVVMLEEATPPLGASEVAAVPGADVALLALDLPRGVRGQNREDVARRQLRDTFGIAPEMVDIRPFHRPGEADRWQHLLVADKALVDDWRNGPGAGARAVLPDYLTLPTAEGLWTVGPGARGIALRLGPADGFGTEAALAPVLLDQALTEAEPPRALLRLGPALSEVEAVAARHGIPVITEDAAAQALATGELAFDLRRDPQLARQRLAASVLPWRWPVLLGLVATVVWAAAQVVVTARITEETTALRAQTTALVQQHFIGNAPVLDVRLQVSQALSAAQDRAAGRDARPDPLALFARAATALARVGARTQSARYSAAEGLQVVAEVDDFAAVEALVSRLEEETLSVDLVETGVSDGGVRATLALEATSE